jgi:hypothetical protein
MGRDTARLFLTGRSAVLSCGRGEYRFGVREGKWKYTFEATTGLEFLTDLTVDRDELQNIAKSDQTFATSSANGSRLGWTSRINFSGAPINRGFETIWVFQQREVGERDSPGREESIEARR